MLENIFNITLLQHTLRTATPLILAAMGGLLTQQAGMLNIGMDGMIVLGAFFGVVGSYFFASSLMGVVLAVLSGVLVGLLFGVFVVDLKSDEFVIGISINMFASGLTVFLLRSIFGVKGAFSSPKIISLPSVHIPFLDKIPFIGTLLNNHSIFVYISWVLVILCYIFLYKTRTGTWIRASGEHPQALETAGISARKMKYLSSLLCGVLCGLSGVHLSLGYLTMFTEGMNAQRGFIAMAAIIFGRAHPVKTALAAMMFGFFDALGSRLQTVGVPAQFTQMIPYVATILALVVVTLQYLQKQKARREKVETKANV